MARSNPCRKPLEIVLTIRAAAPEDAAAIAAFHTEVWREAYRGVVPDDYLDSVGEAERTARWSDRLASGVRPAHLALIGGRVVGVVSTSGRPDEEFPQLLPPTPALELKSLYVASDLRGTGLAATLLETAVGYRAAFLWVFEANHRAVAFYRRQGFRPDGAAKIDPDTGVPEMRMVRVDSDRKQSRRG